MLLHADSVGPVMFGKVSMKQILALSNGIVNELLKDVLRIEIVLLGGFFVNSLEQEEAEILNQCPKEGVILNLFELSWH
ncbi:hypothetical protein DV515_00000569 [Chloebia gouldiae]|uniref:Uncharacterized protein n=1 Tax=Chloebia gouldiae TaxID=44316 RepID=A0A3L8T0M2_CHLGU|nr:hypothetical protein DV515_00000569 [Chloebia gouldiae]